MVMWVGAAIVFLAYATSLSILAGMDWPPLHHLPVQLSAIAGFFTLYFVTVWMMRSDAENLTLIFGLPLVLIGLGAAYGFVIFLFHDWLDSAHRSLTGVDTMKLEKTYNKAEKLEHDKRYEEAFALYVAEARSDPTDAEARRRAGELCLQLDRPQDAVSWMREALPLLENPEARVTLAFRLAEVLEQRTGQPREARALLEDVARWFPGTKFEEYARDRLKKVAE